MHPRTTLAAAIALCGCSPYEPGSLRYRGEFVEVWASDSLVECGGTFDYTDRHARVFTAFAERHGLETEDHIRLFWVDEEDYRDAPCTFSSGCAVGTDAYVLTAPQQHEAVHALMPDKHPRIFDEGIAEMLGDDDEEREREDVHLLDVRATLGDTDFLDFENYPPSQDFVRFIYEQDPATLAAFDAASQGASFDRMTELFDSAMLDFPAMVMAYESRDELCPHEGSRLPLVECSFELTAWEIPGSSTR